jgi:hypothetical protein
VHNVYDKDPKDPYQLKQGDYVRYLLITLLLVGCGIEEKQRPEYNRVLSVDGFEHYVNLFQEQASELGQNIRVSDLVIRFKYIPIEGDKTVLGRCWRGGDTSPTIDIDPEHWKTMSMVARELLMFHEMGHCILRRDHVEDFTSIMNPYLISTSVFIKDEDRLLAELFDSSQYGGLELYDSDRYSSCDHFSSGVSTGLGDEVGHP